jgi:glutamyl-tRNA reductase
MKFAITGLNHKTAPVEVRERAAVSDAALPERLRALRNMPGVHEGLILSTCNRVELALALEDSQDPTDITPSLFGIDGRDNDLRSHVYIHQGADAVRHLFRVAASLDSLVVGEPQILGQLKDAYSRAKELHALGPFLDPILTRAFSVAKRVRSETDIGESAVSVSYAAVELAREIFGDLKGKKVLLLGAGKMSALTAKHLRRSGTAEIYVANRTPGRAFELANEFGGSVLDWMTLEKSLPAMDIVIASTGATSFVITEALMRQVIAARRQKPMFLIDIAVPRNIEPAVNGIDNVFLYDIDDLQQVVDRNLVARQSAAQDAQRIVEEEVEKLDLRLKSRGAAPWIVALQGQLEEYRAFEVERQRTKLGTLSPQQEDALEAITRGLVNKIAHGAIAELRRSAAENDQAAIDQIKRIFKLGGKS